MLHVDDSESPAGLPPRSRSPKDYLDLAKSKSFSCSAFVPAAPATTTNVAEFCDHSIDAQMARAAALQTLDPSAATLLWQQIEHEILAQAPLVPTSNARNVDFFAKRVGNYQFNPQWGVLLDQLWIR